MSFPAHYPGPCAHRCEHGIQPGDDILATAAWPGYVHARECPDPVLADDLTVSRTPCGSCFQVPATNGACGCED